MDSKTFLSKLAGYYGVKPPEGQLPYLSQWVNSKSERFLDYLFAEILKSYPSSFKTYPDIYVMEGAVKKALESFDYDEAHKRPNPDVLLLSDGAKSQDVIDGLDEILKGLHAKSWNP